MLERIAIKDFVIVEQLELDIRPGLTVLTGETGAGKSILLDALGFVLGERADAGAIRPGCERAEVSAIFNVGKSSDARGWLREQELDSGDELIVRRTLSGDGRTRAFINGATTTVQSLRDLGDLLVDIHGQNSHQWLLKSAAQRTTLDDYANQPATIAAVRSAFDTWRKLNDELAQLSTSAAARDTRLDLLRYQVQELDALELEADEIATLDQEHARLSNASRLIQGCEQALAQLDDDDAVLSVTDKMAATLDELARVDAQLAPALELLNSAAIQLHEAARALRDYRDGVELDPERLQEVEDRIAAIHNLARKHRVAPDELPALHATLKSELDTLVNADTRLDALRADVERAARDYRAAAKTLSELRSVTAKKLAAQVSKGIQDLGMRGGVFEIRVAHSPEDFSAHGSDEVEFLVSANPGQPPRALNKVASGGELSRISLAIEVTTARTHGIPTLVFDEVDAGVGGGIAEIIGRKLRALAQSRQVLCITHLPQVAAQGEQHWTVTKQARNGSTRSSIAVLDETDRIDEIARMLGGVKVTAQSKSHAREMLGQAKG
jgi:DNA repair protein RecN (Recombination protein N)